MKQLYESEVLFQLMERDGFNIPSSVPPYESEIKAYLINQVKQAYPKLTDYEAEWLLYNYTKHLPAEFPISTVENTTYAHFENVVPFAYQSAILKGQTLVNIPTKSDNFTTNKETGSWVASFQNTKNMVKNNTKYLIGIFNYSNETKQYMLRSDPFKEGQSVIIDPQSFGYMISTTVENVTSVGLVLNAKNHTEENNIKVLFIEYQDGMENWDIPYFEGMQSVKMPVLTTTGKNLFDGKMELGSITTKGIPEDSDKCLRSVNFIKIKPSTLYTITNDLGYSMALYEYDSDFNFIKNTTYNKAYTTLENTAYIKIKTSSSKVETDLSVKFQIEEGYVGSSYEPFKSNILTVNEDVTLRSNGDICDELNLLTGQLTQRIGEDGVVLSQEVVKTVDITTLNESGETVHFMPLEGIMNVSTSSETILPTFNMAVPVEATTQNLASFINMETEE